MNTPSDYFIPSAHYNSHRYIIHFLQISNNAVALFFHICYTYQMGIFSKHSINERFYKYLCFLLYIVIFILKCLRANATDVLIPVYVLIIFIHTFVYNYRSNKFLVAALFFVLCGDIFINLTAFRELAVIFVLTHIFLTLFYIKKKPLQSKDFKNLLLLALISVILVIILSIYVKGSLLAAAAVYISVVTIMLWRAICIPRTDPDYTRILLASILFYITDIAVLMGFASGVHFFVLLTWLVYPPALFFLSIINVRTL